MLRIIAPRSIKELKKQNETLTEELANLEQNHLTLRSKNKRLEQVSEHSQEELNQFRRSLNESEVQLASEEKRSVTVIGQLQELFATNAELEAENKSHQDGIEQLDQQYRQCVTELESAQCERDTLQSRLRDRSSTTSRCRLTLSTDFGRQRAMAMTSFFLQMNHATRN